MSGVSVAAGGMPSNLQGARGTTSSVGGLLGPVSLLNLQLFGFVIVFGSSGIVPLRDILFPVAMTVYALVLAIVVFPRSSKMPREVLAFSRLLQLYVLAGALLGIVLPLAYMLASFTRGDQVSILASGPHLFLLACQMLSEELFLRRLCSPPAAAIIITIYNGRRITTLYNWNLEVWSQVHNTPVGLSMTSWIFFGKILALANFVFWTFNFMCFLIPIYLPRAFHVYFEARERMATRSPRVKPNVGTHPQTVDASAEKIAEKKPVEKSFGDKKAR